MKSKPGSLPTAASPLADLLVKEFRTCQDLQYLIREERRAMLNHDQLLIEALYTQKQRLFDELSQLELSVQGKIEDIGRTQNNNARFNPPLKPAHILAEYDRETSGRLSSLFEGILALKEKISGMDSVNQTLAIQPKIIATQY
jgi:predicted nuclease with TOPRIM domain